MRALPLSFCMLLLLTPALIAQEDAATAADPQVVFQQHAEDYVRAFNKRDVAALKSMWTPQGEYHNLLTGDKITGHEHIAASLQEFFGQTPGCRLTAQLHAIKMVTESVAKGEGTSALLLPDGTTQATAFVILYVKQGDNWVIDSLTESELPQLTAAQALQDLDWLVGDWQDDTEGITVLTTCKWSRSNAFLIRSFSVQREDEDLQEGTQIIGWDPLYRQIRSWNFFSDGSFGSGFWSKNGDNWLIKSTQTLTDGRVSEGLHVISQITENSMQVQLTSSSIEGELQPTREPVRVIRVTEETAATSPEGVQE